MLADAFGQQSLIDVSSGARGYSFELVQRLSDELWQVPLVGVVDPAFERDLEDRDPCLGRQTRGWVSDAAPPQSVGERRGKGSELDQLALSKLRVRCNNDLALPGVVAALLEEGAGGREGRGYRVYRGRGIRSAGERVYEELLQRARAPKQHLTLVGEVPEEGSLRESRPLGDLRNCSLFESALDEELQRRLLQPPARI
jgi:hypothetical protein